MNVPVTRLLRLVQAVAAREDDVGALQERLFHVQHFDRRTRKAC
jgi:hypothetical protein